MDRLFRIFLGLCVMLAAAQASNVTVSTLNTTVTNSTCGTRRACFSDPVSCNPATDRSCLFVSTKSDGSSNLNFELRGESNGYIAVALSTDMNAGGNDKTYICANNNSAVLFVFALLNNSALTTQSDVSSIANVSGSINQTTIQCVFNVIGLNATSRANAATTFSIVLANGTVYANGSLSNPTVRTVTAQLDLSNVTSTNTATTTVAPSTNSTNASNVTTTITTTTATTTTTSGANISLQHGLSQAVLILLGVLAIRMM
ncbi:putative ferric-chelate reductase 1 isoform X1 [Alosa sapidissima]|uniref:putative ferric-chelate reductase 1 isoform X1 n=1 Tax=Alosa sapidissima TaxID=34773 RepID=UPI001C097D72|nr:putative ferric-chelate reductase 1 isoform X1 [Alosa sapidissima]